MLDSPVIKFKHTTILCFIEIKLPQNLRVSYCFGIIGNIMIIRTANKRATNIVGPVIMLRYTPKKTLVFKIDRWV